MRRVRIGAAWAVGAGAVLLLPVALVFGLPVAVGLGLDVFDVAGEGGLAAVLAAPAALATLSAAARRIKFRPAAVSIPIVAR